MEASGLLWCFVGVVMFRGLNAVSLDSKGRVILPVVYRSKLQNTEINNAKVVITIDTDENCLLLYPLSVWEEIELKISDLPSFNQATRRIQRLLIGHATELDVDSNGRILIPQLLREYAKLAKNTLFVGQGKKIEIWSEELWNIGRESWLKKSSDDMNAIPVELQSLSL